MQKNEGKILLLNFTAAELRSIQQKLPGRIFERGYISNNESSKKNYFYSPVAFYEYSAIFAKLGPFSEQESFQEHKAEFIAVTTEFKHSLLKYWKRDNTLLAAFIGDTALTDLTALGIPTKVKISRGNDTAILATESQITDMPAALRNLATSVTSPPRRYLTFPTGDSGYDYVHIATDYNYLMKNKNGDVVGAVFMKDRYEYSIDRAGAFILPDSTAVSATVDLFKVFGPIYGFGQTASAWEDDLSILPTGQINILEGELASENERHKVVVEKIEKAIESERTRYRSLRDLLTSQGETLVDAVVYVFQDVLGLAVTKSDETQKSSLKEDIVLSIAGSDYLYEIKGTKSGNPSLKYPMQPLTHIARQPDRKFAGAGLILNHDFETKPEKRSSAYDTRETRPLIEDISFIDTRVLHEIAVGVIDGSIDREAVIPRITANGRLVVDESMTKTGNDLTKAQENHQIAK